MVTVLVYLPTMANGWVWDDPEYVLNNQLLRSMRGLTKIWTDPTALPQWYPLVHSSFWLEYQLWGLRPAGYHAVNVLLHAISAVLLWRLLVRLKVPGAWVAAAVFAVHPVMVESVAWVTERKNVLSGVFYLAAFLSYARFAGLGDGKGSSGDVALDAPGVGRRLLRGKAATTAGGKRVGSGAGTVPGQTVGTSPRRWVWYAAAFGLFVCALLSKSVTASLPAAIAVVIWWKRGRLSRRDVIPLVPMLLLGGAMGLHTAYLERSHVGASGPEWDFSLAERVLIAARSLWFYAAKVIWPAELMFMYPKWTPDASDPRQWAWLIATAGLAGAAWMLRHRVGRGLLAGLLLFSGTLFPALGFANVYPMRFVFVADHYQYLAAVALITLVVAWMASQDWPSRSGLVATVATLTVLGLMTARQTTIYKNALTLWTDTAAQNPQSWMAHTSVGHALLQDVERFEREAKRAAEEGRPADAGMMAERARQTRAQADAAYERALAVGDHVAETHWAVALIRADQGRTDESLAMLQTARARNPRFAEAYGGTANILLRHGDRTAAIEWYQKSVEIEPRYYQGQYNLASLLEQSGRLAEAYTQYTLAIAADATSDDARFNRGNVLLALNKPAEAVNDYIVAIELNPARAPARANLGAALLKLGRTSDAIRQFRVAAELDPDLPQARAALQQLTGSVQSKGTGN